MGSARFLTGAAALAVLLFLGPGCDREPIRIGFSGPLTGMYSDLGVNGRNGAQMAVDDINAGGGVDNRKLELVARDDKGTAEGARAADRELIEAGVAAIVGHINSSTSIAALPVVQEAGILLLSPTAGTPELTGKKDLFFRIQPSINLEAEMLARYLYGKRNITRCSTLRDGDNSAYTEPYNRLFVQAFSRLGGSVAFQRVISSGKMPDWESLLDSVLDHGPQALVIMVSAHEAALFVQALRRRDPDMLLLSSGWAQSTALHEFGGRAVEGMLFCVTGAPGEEGPELIAFRKRYLERFGKLPSFAAAKSYDAVRVLAQALAVTGGKAEGLPEAMVEIRGVAGLKGEITLDEYGDMHRPLFITQARDGGFVVLEQVVE